MWGVYSLLWDVLLCSDQWMFWVWAPFWAMSNQLCIVYFLLKQHFRFYNMWIYPLLHSATKTSDFSSPLMACSPLASPARLPLTVPVSIAAAGNTANTLFTHIYHCFTDTCFNGGFVSVFECRWGHIRAAFGAAGAGGREKADPRAAWEAAPAEGVESNTGNIPSWCSQVRGKYAVRC